MPGRNPRGAFESFIEPIRRTMSCITREPVIVSPGGKHELDGIHSVSLANGEPVILNAEGAGITLSFGMQYDIIKHANVGKRYKVRTRGYSYTFSDFDNRELMAYHWHPLGDDGYFEPHVHPYGTKPHYPTGRISIEDVVRTAIQDLHAPPLRGDWNDILAANHGMFMLYRSWHTKAELAQPK